jgi:hypothetical protein
LTGKLAKLKGGDTRATVYPWKEIRALYETGQLRTLDDIAAKYQVNLTTVKNRAAKEGWVASRRRFEENLLSDILTELRKRKADTFVDWIRKRQDAGNKLVELGLKVVQGSDFKIPVFDKDGDEIGERTDYSAALQAIGVGAELSGTIVKLIEQAVKVETAAILAESRGGEAAAPVQINAPNARVVTVGQFLKQIGKARGIEAPK